MEWIIQNILADDISSNYIYVGSFQPNHHKKRNMQKTESLRYTKDNLIEVDNHRRTSATK